MISSLHLTNKSLILLNIKFVYFILLHCTSFLLTRSLNVFILNLLLMYVSMADSNKTNVLHNLLFELCYSRGYLELVSTGFVYVLIYLFFFVVPMYCTVLKNPEDRGLSAAHYISLRGRSTYIL